MPVWLETTYHNWGGGGWGGARPRPHGHQSAGYKTIIMKFKLSRLNLLQPSQQQVSIAATKVKEVLTIPLNLEKGEMKKNARKMSWFMITE